MRTFVFARRICTTHKFHSLTHTISLGRTTECEEIHFGMNHRTFYSLKMNPATYKSSKQVLGTAYPTRPKINADSIQNDVDRIMLPCGDVPTGVGCQGWRSNAQRSRGERGGDRTLQDATPAQHVPRCRCQ